ncbi:hypothetical protein Mgra_00007568 [Meloidogyne graminicola]|uniref:Metalloprotease TIKI homolog n=1 Tax=Meloidogyne graminicola TaxID=189291 RepID=A0A8S9ZIN0_9BILA|nr:hypothetical protein Mgra_00007568 [Meloidogyne graminicola]
MSLIINNNNKNELIITNNKNNKKLFKNIYLLIPSFLAILIVSLILLALLTAIIGLLLPTLFKLNKNNLIINNNKEKEELNNNIFLWLINSTWQSSPSFIFGTIHVPYNKIWINNKMPIQVEKAFNLSDSVILELSLQKPEIVKQLIRCKQLSNGTLRDHLTKELFNRLKNYIQRFRLKLIKHAYIAHRRRSHARHHIRQFFPNDWEIRRPIWLLFLLFQLGDSPPHLQDLQQITSPMLDLYLAQLANERNKNLISIETVKEQCNPIESIKNEQIIFAINYTLNYIEWSEKREEIGKELNNLNNYQSINKLIKHYKSGTLQVGIEQLIFGAHRFAKNGFYTTPEQDKIAKEIDNLLINDILLRRNERMAKRTDLLIRENLNKTLFFALGAGHLLGNKSLIEYLKIIGYQIEPINNLKIEKNQNFKLLEEKENKFNNYLIPLQENNKINKLRQTKVEIWIRELSSSSSNNNSLRKFNKKKGNLQQLLKIDPYLIDQQKNLLKKKNKY